MDHRCPHRCASLFFGRNEEGGLRCVYHGWKFDVDGNCIDMPNVPPAQDFKHQDQGQGLQGRRAQRPGLGLHGRRASRRRRCRSSRGADAARGESDVRCVHSASATGCRRWKATSTPRTSASCMSAASSRRTSIPTTDAPLRCRPRAGIPRHRHRLGHHVRAPTARPSRARSTTASPTSSSRSGRSRPNGSTSRPTWRAR